jgi:hypothetical protein
MYFSIFTNQIRGIQNHKVLYSITKKKNITNKALVNPENQKVLSNIPFIPIMHYEQRIHIAMVSNSRVIINGSKKTPFQTCIFEY